MASVLAPAPCALAPTPKKSPWGAVKAAPAPSMMALQREEQSFADGRLAAKLQISEERAFTDASPKTAVCSGVAATPTEPECDDDAALAARLQAEEDALSHAALSHAATVATPADALVQDDEMLARALQSEYDAENDRQVTAAERRANMFTTSKVSISMDRHRSHGGYDAFRAGDEDAEEYAEDDDEEEPLATVYDPVSRLHRDASTGAIVTKHDAAVCGARNRTKMDHLPLSFASGDMRRSDARLSNAVFNHLKRFSQRTEKQRQRLHEKKEQSTQSMALDATTRLILYKFVNTGTIDEVNGCLSTGKESVVFHGTYRPAPDDPASLPRDCAIKVFKTTITEFKNRQQFMHGDRRYEARAGRQSARKLVRLWAEKEVANLQRMARAGVPCPTVVAQRRHVLIMSFLGADGRDAPKLKNIELSAEQWAQCYRDVVENMRRMYGACGLVHADLSEYNILYWQDVPHFIDVGQSVDATHPRAPDFLFRDCHNIIRFFSSVGVATMTAGELHTAVSGQTLSKEREVDFLQHVSMAKGRAADEAEDTSRVCEGMDVVPAVARVSRHNKDVLLHGIPAARVAAASDDDADDGADGAVDYDLVMDSDLDGDADEDAEGDVTAGGVCAACSDPEADEADEFEVVDGGDAPQ